MTGVWQQCPPGFPVCLGGYCPPPCRKSSPSSPCLAALQVSYAIKQAALAAAAEAAASTGSSRKRARGQNGAPAAAADSGSEAEGQPAQVVLERPSPGELSLPTGA